MPARDPGWKCPGPPLEVVAVAQGKRRRNEAAGSGYIRPTVPLPITGKPLLRCADGVPIREPVSRTLCPSPGEVCPNEPIRKPITGATDDDEEQTDERKRQPQTERSSMTGVVEKKPARAASPLVRALFDAIDRSGLSYSQIAKKAGVSVVTLSYWKHGKNAPRWVDFENVAHVLGYEITIQERDAA